MLSPRRGFLPETTGSGMPTFPFRLHDMLDDAEKKKFDHIVAWQGPQEFKVHDRALFEKLVLPTYFQIRFKSFQRQLAMYGFVRARSGPKKGTYSHEFLIRGKPKMCHFMVRIKIKSQTKLPPSYDVTPCSATGISPSTETSTCTSDGFVKSTIEDCESIEATNIVRNNIESREVNRKQLLMLASRIHRRSSFGSGRSANNATMMVPPKFSNIHQPGMAQRHPLMSHWKPEVIYTKEDHEELFEPMDPHDTLLEPKFADELIRMFDL